MSRELAAFFRAPRRASSKAAERRSIVPSPEEEIQAVLPEDVLAALDAPLEGDDEDDRA